MAKQIFWKNKKSIYICLLLKIISSVAQSNAHPTGDQEVPGLAPHRVRQHFIVEIDHEIFIYGHSLPSTDSRRAVVSFWGKNVHKYWLTL